MEIAEKCSRRHFRTCAVSSRPTPRPDTVQPRGERGTHPSPGHRGERGVSLSVPARRHHQCRERITLCTLLLLPDNSLQTFSRASARATCPAADTTATRRSRPSARSRRISPSTSGSARPSPTRYRPSARDAQIPAEMRGFFSRQSVTFSVSAWSRTGDKSAQQ